MSFTNKISMLSHNSYRPFCVLEIQDKKRVLSKKDEKRKEGNDDARETLRQTLYELERKLEDSPKTKEHDENIAMLRKLVVKLEEQELGYRPEPCYPSDHKCTSAQGEVICLDFYHR